MTEQDNTADDLYADLAEYENLGIDPADAVPSQLEEIEMEVADEDEWEEGSSPYDELDTPEEQDDHGETEARGLLSPSIRHGETAVRWALNVYHWSPSGMCQQFTRSTFAVGSYYGTAISAWNNAQRRHPTTNPYAIPRGVPVFWAGGSRGYGHAAVSLGNGLVRSTDWPRSLSVGTAYISSIERSWGHRLVGWTEDINRVRVWEPNRPVLDAGFIAAATRRGIAVPNSTLLKKAVAAEVGVGDMKMGYKRLGSAFRNQYKEVQEKYLRTNDLRPTRSAADGIPGINSLTWLGERHGFNVRP